MVISDLRSAPGFSAIIANKCWQEWWSNSDISLLEYQTSIERMSATSGIPLALVAHDDDQYIGSVLLIENDLDSRPQYAPWIAALLVEPDFRRRGIAEKLINAAKFQAHKLGHETCYLCATEKNSPYYLARRFDLVERAVEGLNVFAISCK